MRILVTGSRDWTDRETVFAALDGFMRRSDSTTATLVHGGCPDGADAIAAEWAEVTPGVEAEEHPAKWDYCTPTCPEGHRKTKRPGDTAHPGRLPDYCPGAGPRRNREMVSSGVHVCLAFPLGASYGTRGCMKVARAAGVVVHEF